MEITLESLKGFGMGEGWENGLVFFTLVPLLKDQTLKIDKVIIMAGASLYTPNVTRS